MRVSFDMSKAPEDEQVLVFAMAGAEVVRPAPVDDVGDVL